MINYITIPDTCPICGGKTGIKENEGVKTLWCTNIQCDGKVTKKIEHYCSKGRMEVKGLSEKTIEKLIDWGWLNSIEDLYMLFEYRDEWIEKEGFGPKSVDNILKATGLIENMILGQNAVRKSLIIDTTICVRVLIFRFLFRIRRAVAFPFQRL